MCMGVFQLWRFRGEELATPGRLELPAYGLGNRRSILLSYGVAGYSDISNVCSDLCTVSSALAALRTGCLGGQFLLKDNEI